MSSIKTALELIDDLIAELDISSTVVPVSVPNPVPESTDSKKPANSEKASEKVNKPPPAASAALNVNAIDFRVGVIVKVDRHPTAEKLYVVNVFDYGYLFKSISF